MSINFICLQIADCVLTPASIGNGCPLRIPEIYWKIVYNPAGNQGKGTGLVFIVFNSPCPYKNTALYQKLMEIPAGEGSPPCSNINCVTIFKNFGCSMKNEMKTKDGEQVKGLTMCCFKISEALRILGSDAEIDLLPNRVKNNNVRLMKDKNAPAICEVDDF